MIRNVFKFFLTILITSFLSINAFAQSEKEMYKEAIGYIDQKEFAKAYDIMDKLYTKKPKNQDYLYMLGVICLNYPERKERAIEIFESLKQSKKDIPEMNYFLGKAYQLNYKFDQAITLLNNYIDNFSSIKKPTPEQEEYLANAKKTLNYAKNGKTLIDNKAYCKIENIGKPINSEDAEYVPVISADESILIFTYVGPKSTGGLVNDDLKPDKEEGYYHEDIMVSYKKSDSTWSEPKGIESLNTAGHDAAIALSPDGQTLFLFKSTNEDKGDIYVSVLEGNKWTEPLKLNSNINTSNWEGSCSITADGKTLYFASERPGGLGGRDIWVSEKVGGDWGEPKNLGPNINTENDEDAPFIHPDGITLFFSSKGHSSIGGYDIMYSINREGTWITPKNMGIPLNTTEDDRYYVINVKGDRGYFSSNRGQSGGFGKQDIYTSTPGIIGDKPVLAVLTGTVLANDKPIETEMIITKVSDGKQFKISSNKVTGKYFIALSPGHTYKIKISAPGYEPIEEEFDIESIKEYTQVNKNFFLLTQEQIAAMEKQKVEENKNNPNTVKTPTIANTPAENKPCSEMAKPDFSPYKGKSLSNNLQLYQQLINTIGNYCVDGLVFSVQIAAYRHPNNYKYNHLVEYGKPKITIYEDGITRFTQGEFKTLKDCELQRQKAISKGQSDAWIVGFYKGKRYTLEEMIMLDFFNKSVN